jgi:hypothetical protein
MELNYEQARHLKGKMIQYTNKQGKWSVGKVKSVRKDGLVIEELSEPGTKDGYGFVFGGPFFGPPVFFPFVGIGFNPFFF